MMTQSLLKSPALGPMRIQPRPFQEAAVEAVRNEFVRGIKSTLTVLPTGTGKTILMGMLARRTLERGRRTLILENRDSLIEQTVEKLDLLGIDAGIEQSSNFARALFEPDVVVASVQTMKGDRLRTWARDYFDLILTDEAHHALGSSYLDIYDWFGKARHVGVTATPDRGDGQKLGQVFQSLAYKMTLWEAMTAPPPGPYLTSLLVSVCQTEIDLRNIRTDKKGDLNLAELAKRITPHVQILANMIRQEIGDRRTLIFTPDIGSAQSMASALHSMGFRADWIAYDVPNRREKLAKLESGEIQILCNYALITEGVDCPPISAVVLCRPTESRSLYAQMVGRGLRIFKDKKNCLLVDFAYLTSQHNLVEPVELFATSQTDPAIQALASSYIRHGRQTDLREAIERSTLQKNRRELSVNAESINSKHQRYRYSPMEAFETLGQRWRGSKDAIVRRASEPQIALLEKLGVDGAETLSKSRASRMIDMLAERRKAGLATLKQVRCMLKAGVDPSRARSMSKLEATDFLSSIFNRS